MRDTDSGELYGGTPDMFRAQTMTLHRIDWLRQHTDTVYYFTGEQNHPSQDLHRSLGFVEVAPNLSIPIPPPFSNGERHALSKLTLTP